jgi:hypothetical protein
MNNNNIITSLAAVGLALTMTACSKSTPEAPKAGAETSTNISQTAGVAKELAGKAVETAKDVATQVVAVATNAVASATSPFNDGIAAVKKFIADKNYQGALDQLNKLSSLKLTDEQTKVVNGLKTEVQALITKGSAGAVDAAKGLFGK